MANRDLTADEIADAKRLRKIWAEKKDHLHLNQVKAAKELGYSSQSAVSQFINGKVPINLETAAKFARLLKANVEEISPRFGRLITKPIPSTLEAYSAPTTGKLGGVDTSATLDWFAYSDAFCNSIGVNPENLKLVRVDDDSFKEFAAGTIFLVDDSYRDTPVDGIYLLYIHDRLVARRLSLGSEVIISDGKKKQHMSKDAFSLLRVAGKVVCIFSPV